MGGINRQATPVPVKVRYCLYARKSTEQDEQQALSIDSQIKEMTALAAREGLEVVVIKKESHSAKEASQRPIFNEKHIVLLSADQWFDFHGVKNVHY